MYHSTDSEISNQINFFKDLHSLIQIKRKRFVLEEFNLNVLPVERARTLNLPSTKKRFRLIKNVGPSLEIFQSSIAHRLAEPAALLQSICIIQTMMSINLLVINVLQCSACTLTLNPGIKLGVN
jgi:hypothetical protein